MAGWSRWRFGPGLIAALLISSVPATAPAQIAALPPGAAAILLDALRAGNGAPPVPASEANAILSEYVARARARTAGAMAALGAITAIARYPESATAIVNAAIEIAPDSRAAILDAIAVAYPALGGITAHNPGAPAMPTPAAPVPPPAASAAPVVSVVSAAPASTTLAEPARDWQVRLAMGAGLAPEFAGADEIGIVPAPLVDIVWRERLFVNWRHGLIEELDEGIGVNAWNLPNLRVALSLRHQPGRDEDDDGHLRGLGDVDGSLEAAVLFRLVIAESWIYSMRLRQDVADGHEGTLAEFGFGYERNSGPDAYDLALGATWADDDYTESFFGVDAAQAAASGLRAFRAESGFRDVYIHGGATFFIDRHWFVEGRARFSLLVEDAADSPVSERNFQAVSTFLLGYEF